MSKESDAKQRFRQGDYYRRHKAWGFDSDDGFLAAADLVGKTVNIGTKDGLVFEGATVTAAEDGRLGFELTLAGGMHGSPYGGREPQPLTSITVQLWDIARGYVHAEAQA